MYICLKTTKLIKLDISKCLEIFSLLDAQYSSKEALTDEEVESLEVGDVVTLLPDDKQLGIVKSLEEKTAEAPGEL